MFSLRTGRKPRLNGCSEFRGRAGLEVACVRSSHFTEYRYVARQYMKTVPSGLDEWKAKAFSVRSGQQAGAGGIEVLEVFVAAVIHPEQPPAALRVRGESLDGGRDVSTVRR